MFNALSTVYSQLVTHIKVLKRSLNSATQLFFFYTIFFSGGPLCKNKRSHFAKCMRDSQVAFKLKQCRDDNLYGRKQGMV